MSRRDKLDALAALHHRVSLKWAHLPAPLNGGADSGLWHIDAGFHPEADREYFEEAHRILGPDDAHAQITAVPAERVHADTEHDQQTRREPMTDIRSTDPEATNHRKARFRQGWADAVDGKEYGTRVLERLTWQNTGWRLGQILGQTSDELISEAWDWAVEQQKASPTKIQDDHSEASDGESDPLT